uniref:Uncharacterized protein n=1 Tax=Accipiter nisus TaxID=211598 RepID=A0A8B9NS75_9AVES
MKQHSSKLGCPLELPPAVCSRGQHSPEEAGGMMDDPALSLEAACLRVAPGGTWRTTQLPLSMPCVAGAHLPFVLAFETAGLHRRQIWPLSCKSALGKPSSDHSVRLLVGGRLLTIVYWLMLCPV